jgi:mannose-1-phosphate guanylyltransferase
LVATNGDILTGIDLAEVIEAHTESNALTTITLTPVDDPTAYGPVEVEHRLTAGCADIDPCTPCTCERLSAPSDEGYARIMLRGSTTLKTAVRVKWFVEKPGSDEVRTSLVNAGIYVLERQVLNLIPNGRKVSIEGEIFPQL